MNRVRWILLWSFRLQLSWMALVEGFSLTSPAEDERYYLFREARSRLPTAKSVQKRQKLLLFTRSSTLQRVKSILFFAKNDEVSHESSTGEDGKEGPQGESSSSLERELENLQNQLSLIEALEERNKAQIYSFIDEQDQWESLEEEERQLLRSKDATIQRMEQIAEELVQIWMGAKSMDG